MTTETIEKTETTTAPATTEAKTTAPAKEAKTEAKAEAKTETSDYDWRGKMAGDDAKFRKLLDRYTDEPSFGKSFLEKDRLASDPRRVMIPGEDATDEDRAAWAKARGIPDDPKKYEIKVKPPEGMELTDADKTTLDMITARLHKAGDVRADPTVVNEAHKLYFDMREEAESQMMANATIQKEKTEAYLKKIWQGPELKRNVSFADQAIQEFFGEDFDKVKGLQFSDGTRLGDHPEFIQAMAKVGRKTMEDPVFLEAGRGGADPMSSLQKQKDEILNWMTSNPVKYAEAAREGGRLDQINDALSRHQEREATSH